MSVRNFKKAAVCFFDTMATFTSTELVDYRTFCKYAIISCLLAQDRKDIKKQVRGEMEVKGRSGKGREARGGRIEGEREVRDG